MVGASEEEKSSRRTVSLRRSRRNDPESEEKEPLLRDNDNSDAKPLHASDILKFVRVYFPNDPERDYSDLFAQTAEHLTKRNKRVVYVEDPKSGKFVAVHLPVKDAAALAHDAIHGDDEPNSELDEEVPIYSNMFVY